MFANRVKETTTTTGTGNLTLAGADTNFETFNTAFGTSRKFGYFIVDSTNNVWEAGVGYLSAATTLVRETIKRNSAGTTAALNLSAGTKSVFCTVLAEMMLPAPNGIYLATTNGVDNGFGGTAGGGLTVTADRLYHVPFLVLQPGNYDAGIVRVNTAAAGSKGRIGIYEVTASGTPGALIAQTTDIDTTTTGFKTTTWSGGGSKYLCGFYYVSFITNNATVVVRAVTAGSAMAGTIAGSEQSASFGLRSSLVYQAITAGWTVLPDPGSTTPTQDTIDQPYLLLRKT